jgi:predicted DNA-binding protein (MmcQ/YjbR family)
MNIEKIREYCLAKAEVTESLPFDDTSLVFKVNNKMFAILSLDLPAFINLKCDPAKAIELREHYPFVQPGYHMNKQTWNSVMLEGLTNDELLTSWIDDSYDLIVLSMSKKDRERILNLPEKE